MTGRRKPAYRRAMESPSLPLTPTERRNRLIAIALICGAFLCFSLLDTTAKWLSPRIGILETTWVRYTASFIFVSLFLNPWTQPKLAITARPWMQIIRSLVLLGSTALNFLALKYLQLAETISILFLQPMIVALIAGPLLGEWVGPKRLIAIGIGFCGVILVTKPGLGGIHWAATYSFIGVLLYATYSLMTRILSRHDSPETTMFYSASAGIVLLTPFMPFTWHVMPDGMTILLMVAIGFFAALGHWMLIHAHRLAPAPILAPFLYTQIIWMVGLGYLVFGDVPDQWTILGGGIVTAAGLYLLNRERQTLRQPSTHP
jgi:drug/metabolite transporter (DMT)-like permease